MKHVVLTGFMAVGKTAVGRRLARRLDYDFVDIDHLVEQSAGLSIAQIFESVGEDGFRAVEKKIVRELAPEGPTVIATGGGTFVDTENQQLLKSLGVVVCLVVSLETVMQRIDRNESRPLARGDARARLAELYEKRKSAYGCADVLVETDGLSVEQAVSRVFAMITPHIKENAAGATS